MLSDPAFIASHRTDGRAFTRNRVLSFPTVVSFLLSAVKGALQAELDAFFAALAGQGTLLRQVTKSAFSQARQKLRASVFPALNERLLTHAAPAPSERWRGWRLVAADSTTLRLPDTPKLWAAFGKQTDSAGRPYCLARALGLYAVGSRLMLKASLAGFERDERSLLVELLPGLRADDLLLLDRGFPAVWLFGMLRAAQRHFCARIDGTSWPVVEAFLASGRPEQSLTLTPGQEARRRCRQLGVSAEALVLRLVRVPLPSGQIEVLATSLLDAQRYPAAEFLTLYAQRWAIEEWFKLLKCRLAVEHFSGESPLAIEQDFHAKLLLANLATLLASTAHATLAPARQRRTRPNLAYALSALKRVLPQWLLQPASASLDAMANVLRLLARSLEQLRPHRSNPRKHAPVKPRRFRAYKPCL